MQTGQPRLLTKNPNFQKKVTSKDYFRSPEHHSCIEHVKKLEVNYSCVESFELQNNFDLFLVEKNFQKFFMKVKKSPTTYEIALEKSLRNFRVMLKLLKHKIVKRVFVGIYEYQDIFNNLEMLVEDGQLSKFDKYSYMLSLAKLVRTVLTDRDPKTLKLDLNLLADNILVLDDVPYTLRMVRLFPNPAERDSLNLSDGKYPVRFMDAEARNTYLLGKLFFYICFERTLDSSPEYSLANIDLLNGDVESGPRTSGFSKSVIKLIRMMLNQSPIDRPKLKVVIQKLARVRRKNSFFFHSFEESLKKYYFKMKSEIHNEFVFHFKMFDSKSDTVNRLKESSIFKKVVKLNQLIEAFRADWPAQFHDQRLAFNDLRHSEIKKLSSVCKNFKQFSVKDSAKKFEMVSDAEDIDPFLEWDETPDLVEGHLKSQNLTFYFGDFVDLLNIIDELILDNELMEHWLDSFDLNSIKRLTISQTVIRQNKHGQMVKFGDVSIYWIFVGLQRFMRLFSVSSSSSDDQLESSSRFSSFIILSQNEHLSDASFKFSACFLMFFVLIFLLLFIMKKTQISRYRKCEFTHALEL